MIIILRKSHKCTRFTMTVSRWCCVVWFTDDEFHRCTCVQPDRWNPSSSVDQITQCAAIYRLNVEPLFNKKYGEKKCSLDLLILCLCYCADGRYTKSASDSCSKLSLHAHCCLCWETSFKLSTQLFLQKLTTMYILRRLKRLYAPPSSLLMIRFPRGYNFK
jgi:hypothetical protein